MSQRWERLVVAAYTRSPHGFRRRVVRLFTPGYRVGVLVVVYRPDGRILLVDQTYVTGWSLPGGDLKRGETVREGAVRELREELGIDVDVPEPVLAEQRSGDRWVTFVTAAEVGADVAARAAVASPELLRVGWFDPDALPPLHAESARPLEMCLRYAPVPASDTASRANPSSSPMAGA